MKKYILLLMVVMCLLTGCDNKIYHWEFSQEYANVKEIQLVRLEDGRDYIFVKEIDVDRAEELYTDVYSLEMKRYGPNLSEPVGLCILVRFQNGEYDLISQTESLSFKYDGDELVEYFAWKCFNKVQFDALIEKYS